MSFRRYPRCTARRIEKKAGETKERLIPKKNAYYVCPIHANEMKSDLDYLNSLHPLDTTDSTAAATAAPTPAAPSADSESALPVDSSAETTLPTLPLDHPLYATLSPLLETLSLAQNAPEGLDDEAIEQLLKRIESTELAADGLEDRLDQLLGTLDGMLGALEPLEKQGEKNDKEVGEKGDK